MWVVCVSTDFTVRLTLEEAYSYLQVHYGCRGRNGAICPTSMLVVVVRFLIDLAASLAVVTIVTLIATAAVTLAGSSLGVSLRHVRITSGILECIYALVILMRTLWRHWIIAGAAVPENPSNEPEFLEQSHARSSTPSN
jgi:hypothetical protein